VARTFPLLSPPTCDRTGLKLRKDAETAGKLSIKKGRSNNTFSGGEGGI